MTIFFDKKDYIHDHTSPNPISVLVYQVENKVWEKLEKKLDKWVNITLKCIKCENICHFQHRMLVSQIHNLKYCGNVHDFSSKHKLQVMHC